MAPATTITTLDVESLPRDTTVGKTSLRQIVLRWQRVMSAMAHEGIVDTGKESFGFALANPDCSYMRCWDNPQELIFFIGGWGPERDRYIANAVRKIRAAARTNMDTLFLSARDRDKFIDPVDSVDKDGNFPWGDFPWGTALFLEMGGVRLLGAVSTYKEEQDGVAAAAIMADIAAEMFRQEHPGD